MAKKQITGMCEKFPSFNSIEFIPVDAEKEFSRCSPWCGKHLDDLSRILFPRLKPSIDRAIYLDCNVIVIDGVEKLWRDNLNGYALGAAMILG